MTEALVLAALRGAIRRRQPRPGLVPQNPLHLTLSLIEAKSLYDPWGHEYVYNPVGRISEDPAETAEVWSWGPRMNDPNSVITNWD